MSDTEADSKLGREKLTLWLMIGGTASLIIPLLGAAYLHWAPSGGSTGPSHSDVFEHREGTDRRIVPSQTLAPAVVVPKSTIRINQMGSSSLDFIKPTREIPAKLTQPPPPQPPVASVAEIKTAPPVTVKTVPARAAKTKKIFMTPKLKPSRGFTKMGGASNPDPTGTNAPPPGMNPQDLMKNLPPEAANNPQLQQILKQQGK